MFVPYEEDLSIYVFARSYGNFKQLTFKSNVREIVDDNRHLKHSTYVAIYALQNEERGESYQVYTQLKPDLKQPPR